MPEKLTFDEYYSRFLPSDDLKELKKIYARAPRKALRINTALWNIEDCQKFAQKYSLNLEPVPWCPTGFFYQTDEERRPGKYPEYEEGYYYLQDATSMIPPEMLAPQPEDFVADFCAAPGGKTIHLSNLMKNCGLLIANEVVKNRMQFLIFQLGKYCVLNSAVSCLDSSYFSRFLPNSFDRILIDAPCSGEGMRDRSTDVIQHFSLNKILFNAKRQKRILANAYDALKPSGTLVYSTCAISYQENEGVILDLLERNPDAEIIPTEIKNCPGLCHQKADLKDTLRVWPHYFNTNGFFVAKIRKNSITENSEKFSTKNQWTSSKWSSISKNEKTKIQKILGLELNKEFIFKKYQDQIWVQSKKVEQLNLPRIFYAGIKIAEHDKYSNYFLKLTFEKLSKIFKENL